MWASTRTSVCRSPSGRLIGCLTGLSGVSFAPSLPLHRLVLEGCRRVPSLHFFGRKHAGHSRTQSASSTLCLADQSAADDRSGGVEQAAAGAVGLGRAAADAAGLLVAAQTHGAADASPTATV